MAALPEHHQKREPDQHLERGHEHAPEADQFEVAVDVFAIGFVEAANLGFFLCVGAHHAHARQIFLRFGGKHRERRLNLFVERVDHFAEVPDGDGDDGHGEKNPKRERAREPEHQDDGEDHANDGLAAVHDARAEDHAHGVQIVGGARHQFAGAVADVEFRLHKEKAIQQIAADIEFDVARNADENPTSHERKHGSHRNESDKQQAIDAECVAAVGRVEGNRTA